MFKQIKKFLRYLVGERLGEEAFLRKSIESSRISLLKAQDQKEYYAALDAYLAKTAIRKTAEDLEDTTTREAQDNREYFAAMEVYYTKIINLQVPALAEAVARRKALKGTEAATEVVSVNNRS